MNYTDDELHEIFAHWNEGKLKGYLIEITSEIFLKMDVEGGKRLVDVILGVAEQKGTGMWTSQNAMELHVPVPTIDMAVTMRDLSVFKHRWMFNQHKELEGPHKTFKGDRETFLAQLENAVYMSFILTYEQGMTLLRIASDTYKYQFNLEDIARIWRGGCIIRSNILQDIMHAYKEKPDLNTLLQDPTLDKVLSNFENDLRALVVDAINLGFSIPALMASLAYYDAYRGSWLPANLIQAQRDYFGAHSYARIDRPGVFHTDWSQH